MIVGGASRRKVFHDIKYHINYFTNRQFSFGLLFVFQSFSVRCIQPRGGGITAESILVVLSSAEWSDRDYSTLHYWGGLACYHRDQPYEVYPFWPCCHFESDDLYPCKSERNLIIMWNVVLFKTNTGYILQQVIHKTALTWKQPIGSKREWGVNELVEADGFIILYNNEWRDYELYSEPGYYRNIFSSYCSCSRWVITVV